MPMFADMARAVCGERHITLLVAGLCALSCAGEFVKWPSLFVGNLGIGVNGRLS